jgi:hypothetical protein
LVLLRRWNENPASVSPLLPVILALLSIYCPIFPSHSLFDWLLL